MIFKRRTDRLVSEVGDVAEEIMSGLAAPAGVAAKGVARAGVPRSAGAA
jgi:hypothetical protein